LFEFTVGILDVSKHLRFNLSSKEVSSGIGNLVSCVHVMHEYSKESSLKMANS